jgi:hypothetical protein
MRGNVVPPEPKVLQGPRETGRGDSGGEQDSRKRVRRPCGDAAGSDTLGTCQRHQRRIRLGLAMPNRWSMAREPVRLSQQGLSTGAAGPSSRETARRPQLVGRNESPVRYRRRWVTDLARQLRNPLALLLWVAAGLSWIGRGDQPGDRHPHGGVAQCGPDADPGATVGGPGRGAWSNRWIPRSPAASWQHGRRGRVSRRDDLHAVGLRHSELPVWVVLMTLLFPVAVWSPDEPWRWVGRRNR